MELDLVLFFILVQNIVVLLSGSTNGNYNCLTWTIDKTEISLICRVTSFLRPISFIDPSGKEQAKCTFNSLRLNCLSHHYNGSFGVDTQENSVVFVIKGFNNLTMNGKWTCTEGINRFTTEVSTKGGILESTDVHIDGYIQRGNKVRLKCFSCRKPKWKTAEFLIDNRTADSMRYIPESMQCFHSEGICDTNTCSCSTSGNTFTRIFPVNIGHTYNINFSCEMKFIDEIVSRRFLKIATVTFNGTDFIKLPTITEITKAAEMDKNSESNRTETGTTEPTKTKDVQTNQSKWTWVLVAIVMIIVFAVLICVIYKFIKGSKNDKNVKKVEKDSAKSQVNGTRIEDCKDNEEREAERVLLKGEKHADSAVIVEIQTETLPLTGIKDDKNVKDFDKKPLISKMSGEKHADSAVIVEIETETLPLTGIKDDKNVKDFEKKPLISKMSGEKHADFAVNIERETETLPLTEKKMEYSAVTVEMEIGAEQIKGDKHVDSAVNDERETGTLPLTGGKYDNYLKDVEKKPVISQLKGNKDDKYVNDVEKGSLVQLKDKMILAKNEDGLDSKMSQVAVEQTRQTIDTVLEFDQTYLRGRIISGIAVTDDGYVLLCDSEAAELLLFDKMAIYVKTIMVIYIPWDIDIIPNAKKAVLSCKNDEFIQFIDMQILYMEDKKELVSSSGGGIACSNENIFVGGINRIFVLDHKGCLLRDILDILNRNILIHHLSCKQENLYLTDCQTHDIIRIDREGNCTRFKFPMLVSPMKVISDKQGQMYCLGGGSNNIVRATKHGHFIDVPLTRDNGIQCPWTLCFNNDFTYLFISNKLGTSVLSCKIDKGQWNSVSMDCML